MEIQPSEKGLAPEEIALKRIDEVHRNNLERLDLGQLDLTNIPSKIKILSKLKSLSIIKNKISILPPEIGELTNLEDLSAWDNNLSHLPNEITRLRKLKVLMLNSNSFQEFPNEILKLTSLLNLTLNGEKIKTIPDDIDNLINLQELDLGFVNLDKFPIGICLLQNLRKLRITLSSFTSIPKDINKLKLLNVLILSWNNIQSLPSEIGELENLEILNLANNGLRSLPISIKNLKSLRKLYLGEDDPMVNVANVIGAGGSPYFSQNKGNYLQIPPEILAKETQPELIIDYYLKLYKKPLNEIKLLFVGQGAVGKTSIIQRLVHNIFDKSQNKTEGISIIKWQPGDTPKKVALFRVKKEHQLTQRGMNQLSLNFWDFGGQEIMHATHQFFLTKRSLYLLVLDSRLTQEENRVEYWLKIIQSFGGESPVLIVGNKTDQHPLDIDRTGLQKKYPNIVGILETSAATGAGIEALKAAIAEQVNNLPHVRDLLPETWFTVKTKLEELGKQSNFITHDKYLDLCAENEVSDETSQRTLIGFLHDLGVVLHFQDDPRLEALGILNPQWVTNGVYKILNSHTLFQNKGVLTTSMLDEILNLPEYPRGKRLFIVDMMKKFELCYDIEPDKTFLVPDLLPKDEPSDLKFNGIPAFEYAYPVLPSSVITRFIVRMNQKIDDGLVWRTGVLLKIGGNTALVKADIEDRKITIAIDGLEHTRRDALSAIRYQLDEIHNSIKGLNPQKRIPVPNAPNAEPLEYDYLLMLEREGQEFHLAKDGTRLVKVNVREVLSAVESEAQRKETGGTVTNIYIGGNVEGSNIVSGNNNVITQRIQNSFNKAGAADIQAELKNTLKQLADAVAVMAKSLPDEQATEVTDNLSKLVDEATKPNPSKKWYSVSIDGLIKAAENIGKVGEPVIDLSRKVLSLLTGGIIK